MSEHAADSTTRRQDEKHPLSEFYSSSSMGTGSFVVMMMTAVRLDEDPTTNDNDEEDVRVIWFQPNFHSNWVEQPLIRWRNCGLRIDSDIDTNMSSQQTKDVRRVQEEIDITLARIPTTTTTTAANQRVVQSSSRHGRVDKGSSSHTQRRRQLQPPNDNNHNHNHNNKLPIPSPPKQLQIPTPHYDDPQQTKTSTTTRIQRPTYNSHSHYFHHHHHQYQYPSASTVLPRRTRLLPIRSTHREGPEEKEELTTTATTTLPQQQQKQQQEEEYYDLEMASIGGSEEASLSLTESPDRSSSLRAPMAPGEDAHGIHTVEDDGFTLTYHGDNEENNDRRLGVTEPPPYHHRHPTIVVSPENDDPHEKSSTSSTGAAAFIEKEQVQEWTGVEDLVEDAHDDSMKEEECDYFVLPRSKRNLLEHSSSPSPSSSSSTLLKGDFILSPPRMERILEEQVEVELDNEEAEAEEALSSSSSSRTSVIQPAILFSQDEQGEGLQLLSTPVHSCAVVVPPPQGHPSTERRSHRMAKDNSPDHSTGTRSHSSTTSTSHPSVTSTTDGSHWDMTADTPSPQVEQDGDREVVWV